MLSSLFLAYAASLMAFNVWLDRQPSALAVKLDRHAFILFSILILGFATFRPFGVALDDYGYYMKYDALCPVSDCHLWVQSQRDFLWFSLVALLMSVHHSPDVMLWLAGFGLFLKLCVIYGLCRRKCLALLVYVSLFYLTDDVTALRMAFATGIFFVAFWLLVIGRVWLAAPLMAGMGFIHVQELVAPVLLVARLLPPFNARFLLLGMLIPLSMLVLGVTPGRDFFASLLEHAAWPRWTGFFVDAQQHAVIVKEFLGLFRPEAKLYPVVAPLSLLAVMIPLASLSRNPTPLVMYSGFSLILAAWVLWGLSFNETVQFRFFSFFLIPVVFIAGTAAPDKLRLSLFIVLSLMYLVKYNVLHTLLTDRYHLTVIKSGDGIVKSAGPIIECGDSCETDWGISGIGYHQLPLYAMPATGYRISMAGDCGASPSICYLKMDRDRVAIIDFIKTYLLSASKTGQGQILAVGGGLGCGERCNYRFDAGRRIKLLAKPEKGHRFDGWSGACQGQQSECTVEMTGDTRVGARFVQTYQLKITRVGDGRVVSSNGSLDCGSECTVTLDEGGSLSINAWANPGSRFESWSGACTGNTPVCNLDVRTNIEVSATFVKLPPGQP